jgi:hypothetical protein
MTDPGPKQESLFSTAAKQSRGRGRPAKPKDEQGASATGPDNAEPASVAPRPLYIGPVEIAAIKALIERAHRRPVLIATMKRRAAELKRGITPPASLNREFTIKIPQGFTATYTHEEQPLGFTRHLSIAADRPGRMPHPIAVDWLMREFGFRATKLHELDAVWLEDIGNDRKAINLVEYLVRVAPDFIEYPIDPDAEEPEQC